MVVCLPIWPCDKQPVKDVKRLRPKMSFDGVQDPLPHNTPPSQGAGEAVIENPRMSEIWMDYN